MNDAPAAAPASWGLTEEEIERFSQDLVGEPAEGEDAWRPAGGSLLGGIGQCLYDELAGIWDLITLLYSLDNDIDVAADGEDNFFRSRSTDFARTLLLFHQLDSGAQDFAALPYAQRQALFRVYAKWEAIKSTLLTMAEAGICVLAAYDVIWNSEYEILTWNQGANAVKLLADAVSLFFDDDEWVRMAESGQALAEEITAKIQARIDEDPWGSSGYAVCMIVLLISPTKIVRALKPMLGPLRSIANMGDFRRVLREHKIKIPDWAGGQVDELAEGAGDLGRQADEVAEASGDLNRIDDGPQTPASGERIDTPEGSSSSGEPIPTRDDARPRTTEDPEGLQPTPPNGQTSIIRLSQGKRSNVAGEIAEEVARRELQHEHPLAEVVDLKYEDNKGLDNLVIYRGEDGMIERVINVEVKSRVHDAQNPSAPIQLKGPQAGGAANHLEQTFQRLPEGHPLRDELEIFLSDPNPNIQGEVRGYLLNPETGEVLGRTRQSWTSESRVAFDLEADYSGARGDPMMALQNVLRRLQPATLERWYNQYPELRSLFDSEGNILR